MNQRLLFSAAAALLLGAVAAHLAGGSAQAAGGRSRFEFAPGSMSVAITGTGRDAANYYLPYTIKNPMDEAMTPRIYVEAKTETGKTYGDHPDHKVIAAAEKALKTKGLKTTLEVRAEALPAGGSVQGVASFGNIDPNADDITVRVYGLWDPIVRTRQGKVYSEKRVLVLEFARQGDEYDRPMDQIKLKSSKEVLEGDPVELYSTATEKKK